MLYVRYVHLIYRLYCIHVWSLFSQKPSWSKVSRIFQLKDKCRHISERPGYHETIDEAHYLSYIHIQSLAYRQTLSRQFTTFICNITAYKASMYLNYYMYSKNTKISFFVIRRVLLSIFTLNIQFELTLTHWNSSFASLCEIFICYDWKPDF